MVIKRLACAFRLSDGCSNRPLTRNEVRFTSGGVLLKHEYKPGGYFVLCDIPTGEYAVDIAAPGYQPESVPLTVDYSGTALDRVKYLALNPSRNNPAAGNLPSVCGTAFGCDTVYSVRQAGSMRVAEDSTKPGATGIRMFSEPGTPQLPSFFLLGSGKNAELVLFTENRDGVCIPQSPLKKPHQRSETAQPLVRLRCSADGGFFQLLPGTFKPDKETGKFRLTFAADISGKVSTALVEASVKGCTDLGVLKFTGGK